MKVRDLMTHEVATVRPEHTLARAARLMQERDCGCVAVTDEASRVVGILTDRDVCLAALDRDRALSKIAVADAMTSEVVACSPDDDVPATEKRMGLHQVRRVPVVDARGDLVGILSLDDLARESCREADLIVPPVSEKGVGRTLGQISRPHLIEEG